MPLINSPVDFFLKVLLFLTDRFLLIINSVQIQEHNPITIHLLDYSVNIVRLI